MKPSNTEHLPLAVAYSRTLPNLKTLIDKSWHVLQVEPPVLAFKRNKNLQDINGGNKVFDNKQILNVKKSNKGKCQPCFTRSINFCCKKLKPCSAFQSVFKKTPF